MATHLYTYDDPPAERDLRRALEVLGRDGVLAYPNEVNWAFGCDAASSKALDRIYQLKPTHPKDLPFSLICSSMSMAADYALINNAAYRLLRKAWPGPFTVLLPSTRQLPRQLKDKRRVVGIRIPRSPMLQALVERLGRPLATTSVPPIPGHASGRRGTDEADEAVGRLPRFGYEVFDHFGHGIDLLLDLGAELTGQESTIVDLTSEQPVVVRRGAGDAAIFETDG